MKKDILIVTSPDYLSNVRMTQLINKIPEVFDYEGVVLHNKRNVIKSYFYLENDTNKDIIVKRYKKPNFIQKIVYSFFRPSKAKRAFLNAVKLKAEGIETPQAISYIEIKEYGLFRYGYYISEADYSLPIADKLITSEIFDKNLARAFAAFVAKLHLKGILHNDLNSTNVLFHTDKNNEYVFSVIDINRMKFCKEYAIPSKRECLENLTRFTGRMDLFRYVISYYSDARCWNRDETIKEAINIKEKHDLRWKKRKAFLRKFKVNRKTIE